MTGEGEHFAAEPHELDTVLLVPAQHFDDVICVGDTEGLNERLAQSRMRCLGNVARVLRLVKWLCRVL